MDANKHDDLNERLKRLPELFKFTGTLNTYSFNTENEADNFINKTIKMIKENGFYIKKSKKNYYELFPSVLYELILIDKKIHYFYKILKSIPNINNNTSVNISIIPINKFILTTEYDDINRFCEYLPNNRNEKMIGFAYAVAKEHNSTKVLDYIKSSGLLEEFGINPT